MSVNRGVVYRRRPRRPPFLLVESDGIGVTSSEQTHEEETGSQTGNQTSVHRFRTSHWHPPVSEPEPWACLKPQLTKIINRLGPVCPDLDPDVQSAPFLKVPLLHLILLTRIWKLPFIFQVSKQTSAAFKQRSQLSEQNLIWRRFISVLLHEDSTAATVTEPDQTSED